MTVSRKWSTLPDGRVLVNSAIPTLDGVAAQSFATRVMRWRELVEKESARTGVPAAWLLGMIWRESGGDPSIVSFDHGVGLLQLTSAVARAGRTDDELKDPATNIRLGAEHVARLTAKRPDVELPEVASMFNAGTQTINPPHRAWPSLVYSPTAKPWVANPSPWGMRETKGHIDAVVAGSNRAIELLSRRTLRVLPVGDSLTAGLAGGYRAPLRAKLASDGVDVTFVGELVDAGGAHDGHTGKGAAWLADRIGPWLAKFRPTDVVIMAGTNDAPSGNPDAPFVRLVAMVDAALDAGSRVVLCTIPPLRDFGPFVETWNRGARGLVVDRASMGRRIVLADVHSAVSLADLGPDGVHPSSVATYERIAEVLRSPVRDAGYRPDPSRAPTSNSGVGALGVAVAVVGVVAAVLRRKG